MVATASYTLEQTRQDYPAARPRVLDELRGVIRWKSYSIRTEIAYVDWVRRFVRFCDLRHQRECGAAHVEAFLTHLAVERHVTASTQNQARSALLFLYKEVLGVELPWLDDVVTAKRPAKLPVVLTVGEVQRLLERTDGVHGLVLRLLYGTGMRVLEALRLRVKDVDFERREIVVSEGRECATA
jgi:site-specific recombinase XerD